jgi:hypothetical protein
MKKDSMIKYYNRKILIWSLVAIGFLALVVAMLIFLEVSPGDAGLKGSNIACSLFLGISLGQVAVSVMERDEYKKELK